MYLDDKPLLLIGGVPGDTPESVFRLCAPAIGDRVAGLTDGEPGFRSLWVVYIAPQIFAPHPDIKVANRPKPKPGVEDWIPGGWDDLWRFTVKDGVTELHFETLRYAEFARESYAKFVELRDAGVILAGTRYQVCIPFPEDCTRWCCTDNRSFEILTRASEAALARDIAAIVAHIPAEDLLIQWDICWEVFAYDTGDYLGEEPLAWKAEGDPLDRYVGYVQRLSPLVLETVPLGLHLCYGDLGHTHLVQPKDLTNAVTMANAGVNAAGRRVDYVHVPVPRDRHDDAYFEPLQALAIGDTKLYIGLIHYTDGVEGAMQRFETFRNHYNGDFGVATECGWGRRPQDQSMHELIEIHGKMADAL